MDYRIVLRDVSSAYAGMAEENNKESLKHVFLEAGPGECVLVTGPSGCGKTTLLRVMCGLVPHYFPGSLAGEVRICGQIPAEEPLYAMAGTVSCVLQNPKSQFYTDDPVSELAFALENLGVPGEEIRRRIESTADRLEIASLMEKRLSEMSGGERQKIACACADVSGAQVILMDEPTANLDFAGAEQLREIIRIWKAEGKTIVIAEHRLSWVLEEAASLVLMQSGRITDQIDTAGLQGDRRSLEEVFAKKGLRSPVLQNPEDADVPEGESINGGVLAENLYFSYGSRQVLGIRHLPIAEGKITAIVGKNGAGKTTLLRCLAGLEKRDRSVICFHGETWKRREKRKNVYLIFQDVNFQLFTQEVREEIMVSLPEEIRRDPERAEQRVRQIAGSLDLEELLDRDPSTLSGGQKQRCAVAGAVASGRRILLFDEPTSGLDAEHMLEMAKLLKELAGAGKTILVATHDSELIRACADYKWKSSSDEEPFHSTLCRGAAESS